MAKRPAEYGLDYRYASLTNIVEFAVDNPGFVADAETSAEGKIKRSLEHARPRRSEFRMLIAWDTEKWGKVVRAANMKVE